jgi:hypothetical protein
VEVYFRGTTAGFPIAAFALRHPFLSFIEYFLFLAWSPFDEVEL